MPNLFGLLDPEDEEELNFPPMEPGECERCTPERLLAFIQETRAATGKSPTLRDLKQKFGGILGPLIDGWELKRRGLL